MVLWCHHEKLKSKKEKKVTLSQCFYKYLRKPILIHDKGWGDDHECQRGFDLALVFTVSSKVWLREICFRQILKSETNI